MTIISPSLLSCNFLNIKEEILPFNEVDDLWFHLDIMDGNFVPNLTFGHPIIKKISQVAKRPLDAHLMVVNPEFYIDTLKNGYNIHNFTFHLEALNNCVDETLRLVEKSQKYFPSIGISIKPDTPISVLTPEILLKIDLLLVMSVEPGFGGQGFIESTYDKLKDIQRLKSSSNYSFMVQIDGGVSDSNAQKIVEHGVDNLVAGSYIFKAGNANYLKQVESLR